MANGQRSSLRDDTRDFLKLTAYLSASTYLPFLSERHVITGQFHAGYAPRQSQIDRHNAFRIGGGPLPSESNDLSRSPFPGAMFDQFTTRKYFLFTAEYRFEVMFFFYVHLRATLGWGDVPVLGGPTGPVTFRFERAEAYSVAITSGFLWSSLIHAEYIFDNGVTRAGGRDGHTFLFTWSKSF